jgi:predicted nucleic acid-binding protein
MRNKRFVLDPNIYVSYFITRNQNILAVLAIRHKLEYPIKRYIPQDENDDYLVALALQTSSGYITSGDNDILSEKKNLERKYKKLTILTKAEFDRMFA